MTEEKNVSRGLRNDLLQLEGNSCSLASLKKSKVARLIFEIIAICKFGETFGI